MIWIDTNQTVIGVTDNIATSTYPSSFSPSSPARYVIEVGAGVARALGIEKGIKINF